MNKALDVANYVISYCNEKNIPITHLKLQKLLYFIQANFLFVLDKPCFNDEIIALPYGPVVRSVFEALSSRNVGASQLTPISVIQRNLQHTDLIDNSLNELAHESAFTLVEITHNQSPWIDAIRRQTGTVITNDAIRDYFND